MVKPEMEVSLYVWRSSVCLLAVGNRHGHWALPPDVRLKKVQEKVKLVFGLAGYYVENVRGSVSVQWFPFSFFTQSTD